MLDAHQLNIFLIAAETLNFTKAAEQLHMSQPSVSQHIRALEKHFDTKLFIRQGRSLSLSDAGRTLIPLARQFVKQSTCIDEAMSSLKGQIQGRICIACNAPAGKYILPEFFAKFHRQYPEVTIACQTDTCELPYELLQKGTTHFVVSDQVNGLTLGMESQDIFKEDICLITAPDHPWAEQQSVEIDQLQEGMFILPDENTSTFKTINAQLLEHGASLRQLDTFLTLSNPEAIIMSVEKGLGVGFASRVIAGQLAKVTCIPIAETQISRVVSISHNTNQPSTEARKAFWDFIVRISAEIQS
jgi:DNA-binding transcriptional LysR family regulator